MPTFGKLETRQRSVPRAKAGRPASLATAETRYLLTLIDVSRTGARLSGPDIPEEGDGVHFRALDIDVFATVVWTAANECAVDFATAIAPSEVQRLQAA